MAQLNKEVQKVFLCPKEGQKDQQFIIEQLSMSPQIPVSKLAVIPQVAQAPAVNCHLRDKIHVWKYLRLLLRV